MMGAAELAVTAVLAFAAGFATAIVVLIGQLAKGLSR